MGKLYGGIYGQVRGKVGNLVTYKLLGEDVVRLVGECTKAPTVRQLAGRQQMAVVVRFLKPLIEFVNVGFLRQSVLAGKYPHNMAVSFNKRFALMGSYPAVAIDYARVSVSQGSLPPADGAVVELVAEGLRFSWATGPKMDWPEGRHVAMLLAYFPDLNRAVYSLCGAKRYAGFDVLFLDVALRSAYMETYISFIEVGTNEAADSVYTGKVNGA